MDPKYPPGNDDQDPDEAPFEADEEQEEKRFFKCQLLR